MKLRPAPVLFKTIHSNAISGKVYLFTSNTNAAFKQDSHRAYGTAVSCRKENTGKLQNRQNWPFQINLDHFGRKILEKLQNSQNWPFQIKLEHFGRKILEKLQNSQNWPFLINSDHFGRKILEKLQNSMLSNI